MYTRCPHCTTIFQITADQLRRAHGDVPCVTCTQSFNALESLSDDITALIAAPPLADTESPDEDSEKILDGADTVVDPDRDTDDDPGQADDDETAREESLGDTDNEDDTQDQPLPDLSDIELEDTDDPEVNEVKASDAEDTESEGDESTRDEPSDDTDNEDDAQDQPLLDLSDIELEDTDDPEVNEVKASDAEDTESEGDESTREEASDDTDSGDDTWDRPLPDLPDSEPEDAKESGHSELDDDESMQEETPDAADSEDNARDEPLPDLPDNEILADAEPPGESMEFNAPEQTWTKFFLTDEENVSPDKGVGNSADKAEHEPWIGDTDGGALENQTEDQGEWQIFLAELEDDPSAEATENGYPLTAEENGPFDDDGTALDDPFGSEDDNDEAPDETEPSVIPPWLADESADEMPKQGRRLLPSWRVLGTVTALALLLAGQLIHYNRDALAAHATYGAIVRNIYAVLGISLYPDWPLDSFEVTGTEAIAGRSNQDALDVLANVIVTGRQPVGLPLIRIVLRDRWTNPVASRVFEPNEYLRRFEPANSLINPGTALPVEVSVADPGAAAMGYIVDVCLPRRKTGLECQIARDPFQ